MRSRTFAALVALLAVASLGACSAAAPEDPGIAEAGVGSQGPGDAMPASGDDAQADAGHDGAGDSGNAADGSSHADGGGAADGALADASTAEGAIPEAAADAPLGGTWSSVSYGVTTRDTGGGDNIVIAYGGYTATDADSQAWVAQMTTTRLAQLGVGHMYAVRGPEDPDYAAREIGNSELAAALATQATPASYVIIMAHSSGGFVADELFTFVDASVMGKIAYFNLDGGSWSLTDTMVGQMRGVYFCNAHDAVAGDSENTSSDEQLHADFPASHAFTVDADGSGCNVGAGWCLHDTLITTRPHDPATYDLALDYADFTGGRNVVTSYVDQAVSDGVL
jgi:hypothetical protein